MPKEKKDLVTKLYIAAQYNGALERNIFCRSNK
jgi:hypothetical protein